MSLLCVPIMVRDVESALADAHAAATSGADLVEFRVDEFFTAGPDAQHQARSLIGLVARCPVAAIVTCRHKSEGGAFDAAESQRLALYRALADAAGPAEHPPRYLDFELDQYGRSPGTRAAVNDLVDAARLSTTRDPASGQGRPLLILSSHDFNARPADLSRRILRMRAEPVAAILKVAFRARSIRDNLELFDLLGEKDRPMIALAMGEFGLMSRVLAPKFGGFLTFAALRRADATAPGQPTVRELLDTFRFRSINRRTRVYGVAGWPVGHSLSPLVHNAGFDAITFNGVYLPLPIAAPDNAATDPDAGYLSFKATLTALADHRHLDLSGLSVTIPHKENLVRLARELGWELDELSNQCGAANTLAIERDDQGNVARARVFNTDATAALACLQDAIGQVQGRHVAVIGAGGVARAIIVALARAGALVTIFNRSLDRAQAVADAASAASGSHVRARELDPDIRPTQPDAPAAWVNCTPLGMKGGPDPEGSPLSEAALSNCPPGTAVLDTVYNPPVTPLLARARAAGLVTIDGVLMFVRQAEAQFHAWTGTNAPPGLFERTVRGALGA